MDPRRATSADLTRAAHEGRWVCVAPLGAFEQHGPHLPLSTDTLIADRLGKRLGTRLHVPVLVVPTLPVGMSDHHLGFAGTVTVREEFIRDYLDAIARMVADARGVALLVFSSHGGNFKVIADYCSEARSGQPPVFGYDDLGRYLATMRDAATAAGLSVPQSDIHAGGLETSQVKYLIGDDKIVVPPDLQGLMTASPGWVERLLAEGVKAISPSGVLGRPQGSTATVGEQIFGALEEELTRWASRVLAALLPSDD
jgi:creatinine amidohydrolase